MAQDRVKITAPVFCQNAEGKGDEGQCLLL